MLNKIISTFQKNDRSTKVNKNIAISLFAKGMNICVSLLYIPLTLNYLNETRYGIWMTLTSIVSWIGVFDIGLTNGLRNKLSNEFALHNFNKAQKYVSTTYFILSIIVMVFVILFYLINYWLDWSVILNTEYSMREELSKLVLIVITFFGLRFVLQTISTIYTADQSPSYSSILELIINALSLLFIWLLTVLHLQSLLAFAIVVMSIPVLIYFIASILGFRGKYNNLLPKWSAVDMNSSRDLVGLGIQFFVIQIAVLVIFQTSNIIISQLFTPADVTPYNIAFKYFGVVSLIWGIIMAPLWSAFTNAKALNDINWIKSTVRMLNFMIIPLIILLFLMSYFGREIILLWTNDKVNITISMILFFALYTLISIWNNIYAYLLNGTNEIRVQIYTSVVAAIIHIPLSIFLVNKIGMGPEGVVLSMIVSLSFFAIIGPIKSFRLIKEWEKNL